MSKSASATFVLANMLIRTDFDTFKDRSDTLKPNVRATVDHRSSYRRPDISKSKSKTFSGSRACDPIAILDDDEPDTAEINYIDLENDNEASTPGHNIIPVRQTVAGAYNLGFPPVAKRPNSYNIIQGPDPATNTKRDTQPLFRALTKDDLPGTSMQSVPEARGIGFKAWYGTSAPYRTGNAGPTMQEKRVSQNPSIKMFNEERTMNVARKNGDAPHFAMNVLNAKRKRTMDELGYNELISPAQIESPTEKLARIAKKRRQRQSMCDGWSQNINNGNTQCTIGFDHAHGHENDKTTEDNTESAVSPIAYDLPEGLEIVVRESDEHSGPSVVRASSPVSTQLPTEDQNNHPRTQSREDYSDGHLDGYGTCSKQINTQARDAQEHGDGTNAAYSSGRASRKPRYHKPRVGGPTDVCGVFSPEKKPPVKRSCHGAFHCPRCDSQFTTSKGVNYHFEKCIATYGNPRSLKWDDHPSLSGVVKRVISTNKMEQTNDNEKTIASPAQVPAIQKSSASITHDTWPVGSHALIDNVVAPLAASNIQVISHSVLPEKRSTTEEQTLYSGNLPKLDHQMSIVEHRTTSGKGLSAETLNSFRETGNWDRRVILDQSADEAQDEEMEVPEVAYRYFVQKREWLDTEEDAIESSMGPFYTLNEANTVAKAEVQCPQLDGFEGIQSKGWSYYYRQDEHGMQMHMAIVLEINIEAVVHRGE